MRHWMVAAALAGAALVGAAPGGMGQARAAEKLELSTRVSGVVAEVLVKSGQRVKKGTVLLRLDRTVLQARLDEAAAEHARAQAEDDDAARDFERAQELFNRAVTSSSEFEAATLRRARAQAMLSVARARHAIAQKDLADAELQAPVDGVVNAVPGGPGTVVTADCQPKTLIVLSPGR